MSVHTVRSTPPNAQDSAPKRKSLLRETILPFAVLIVAAAVALAPAIEQHHARVEASNAAWYAERAKEADAQGVKDARRKEADRRWWALQFYEVTVYEPGDFPKAGYYRGDGTLWTPEEGGAC